MGFAVWYATLEMKTPLHDTHVQAPLSHFHFSVFVKIVQLVTKVSKVLKYTISRETELIIASLDLLKLSTHVQWGNSRLHV